MCELMGFSFAQPIHADFSIHAFAPKSADNPDGWGLAWYPDRSVALIKEVGPWKTSLHSGFLETYPGLLSRICIAHVRHLTTGQSTHADTHPFIRELHGTDYAFAHNGTVAKLDLPSTCRFRPVGTTDSERLFCKILDQCAAWEQGLARPEDWPRLHALLADLNQFGTLNLLLTDGDRLICHHDAGGWKGLHFRLLYLPEHGTRRFEDADLRLDLNSAANFGVVVATSKLSPNGWEKFEKGEMLVLEQGRIRYSSHGRHAPRPGLAG